MVTVVIIDISSVIFGITGLILASKARKRLSEGAIRKYIDNFSVCLSFIVIFSLWRAIRDIIYLDRGIALALQLPEYIFIVGIYIAFIIASYRVVAISHEFGFKKEGETIERILKKRK